MQEKLALTKNDIAERLAWFLAAAFAKDPASHQQRPLQGQEFLMEFC